ncbi:MAG: ankyrin repeat domain-containing protein [Pirellulaceae bacterium]|nr:ankyrin repeat domain-containing protein [Pirellulaceae bacterium]
MRITLRGPAMAVGADDQPITDAKLLRQFSGLKSGESCVEYFTQPLNEIHFEGGQLEFVFDESLQQLAIQTVYFTPRELKKKDLKALIDETCGQWSDGIGENGLMAQENPEIYLMAVFPLNDSNFSVEQIDDGTVVKAPRKSPLFAAAMKGDTAKLKKLLSTGEDVHARDRERATPLIVAVQNNQLEAVQLLIDAKSELNTGNKMGSTAVLIAAMFGRAEILEALLKAGADPNYCDPNDYSEHPPLHLACNRGQFDCVKLLVQYGASINYQCRGGGYSAIMHLSEKHVDIARFLIEHGADVSLKSLMGTGVKPQLLEALS